MQLRSSVRKRDTLSTQAVTNVKKAKDKKKIRTQVQVVLRRLSNSTCKIAENKKADNKVRKSVSFSNNSRSISSTFDEKSANSSTGSSRNIFAPRNISTEFNDLSSIFEKSTGKCGLQSFEKGVERFKKRGNIVASTPLPPQLRKLDSDLTGTYWSPNSRTLKRCGKIRSLRPTSCSDTKTKRRTSSRFNSCPPLGKRPRTSKGTTDVATLPSFLLSKNVPKKKKRKDTGKGNKDIVSFYLSSTFTSVKKKKRPDVSMLQKSLIEKGLSHRNCYDPNKTEISLLNKKKKLYSNNVTIFARSPASPSGIEPKSILKSKRGKSSLIKTRDPKGKEVRLKLPMVHDMDKENYNPRGKCKKNTNGAIRLNKTVEMNDSNPNIVSDSNTAIEYLSDESGSFIKSKDKMIVSAHELRDGSYEAPPEQQDANSPMANQCSKSLSSTNISEKESCSALHEEHKAKIDDIDVKTSHKVVPTLEQPIDVMFDIDKPIKQSFRKKKKKKLLMKQHDIFDTEVDHNNGELSNITSTTCNKTIMESALHMIE